MATKSFFKNVNLKNREQVRNFVTALEKAENFRNQDNTIYNRKGYVVGRNELDNFADKIRWGD